MTVSPHTDIFHPITSVRLWWGGTQLIKNFFLKGVEYLIHDIAKQHLVKKYGYPENVANIVYDPHFPIRGEWSNKWEDDFHSFALAPFVVCLWLKCADLNRYTFSLYTDLFAHTLCMYLIKYFLIFCRPALWCIKGPFPEGWQSSSNSAWNSL